MRGSRIWLLWRQRLSSIRLMTTEAEISRLAASGITSESGLSMTSSVTIRPRLTGRQCMNLPWSVTAMCAVAFIALWWLFPDTYPYTDTAAFASAALAAVNLLPAHPLDGGRILYCIAAKKKGEPFARRLMLVCSGIIAAGLVALFICSVFVRVNFTILFFALFIVCGMFGGKDCRYTRIRYSVADDLKRGMEIKKVALRADCTVKKALSYLERGKYLEITVFDEEGEYLCELTQSEFCSILDRADIYRPLSDYLDAF